MRSSRQINFLYRKKKTTSSLRPRMRETKDGLNNQKTHYLKIAKPVPQLS